MKTPNVYLVRSPYVLVKEDLAGYGWPQINFTEASSSKELLGLFHEKNIELGRQKNQIKRFFNISKGDIIVAPMSRSIAIGFATGVRSYEKGVGYGENRISVEFLRNSDNSLIRIPRSELSEALSTRLKIRMTVVSLEEFREEVLFKIDQVKNNGGVSFDSYVALLQEESLNKLHQQLLENIRNGKTNLQSGGYGLEKLVKELLELEGYTAKILSTRAFEGTADADLQAFRANRFSSDKLLIQVKHHYGTTGYKALDQLRSLDNNDDAQLCIITTGKVSPEMKREAEEHDVSVMDGDDFIDWLLSHTDGLSVVSMNKLGLSKVPTLLLTPNN